MKVYFDSQIFRKQRYGGISNYFANLIAEFIKHPEFDVQPIFNYKYIDNYYLEKFNLNFNEDTTFPKSNTYGKLKEYYTEYIHKIKPDLIHFTYYLPNVNTLKNIPKISTIHDFIPEQVFSRINPNYYSHYLKNHYLDRSEGLIFVSNETRGDFINRKKNHVNFLSAVIYHGVSKDNLQHKIKNLDSLKYFLYVGNRQGYKNFPILLNAFSEIIKSNKEVKLICYGGPSFNKDELEMLKRLSLITNILHINDRDGNLAELFSYALAFINPSKIEGFGMTNLESLAHGCAVICSDIPVFREILKDKAHYFYLDSTESLTLLMRDFTENSQKALPKVKVLIEFAEQYSWCKTAEQTANFYHKCLASKNKGI